MSFLGGRGKKVDRRPRKAGRDRCFQKLMEGETRTGVVLFSKEVFGGGSGRVLLGRVLGLSPDSVNR